MCICTTCANSFGIRKGGVSPSDAALNPIPAIAAVKKEVSE